MQALGHKTDQSLIKTFQKKGMIQTVLTSIKSKVSK